MYQKLVSNNQLKTRAAHDMIRSIMNDTITDLPGLRNWLDNLNNINADMQIVSTYMHEGDYTSAQTLLDLIPGLYTLEGAALNNYNDYKSVTEMQMLWQQQGRDIFELNETEIASLVDYADNSSGKAATIAQGILEFAYGYEYCNCPPVGDSTVWKSSGIEPQTQTIENSLFVGVTPNPANTWVAFDYKLPKYASDAVLEITDLSGKAITAFKLNSKQGQYVWDIRDIEKGLYIYTLKAGSLTKSGKLVIE